MTLAIFENVSLEQALVALILVVLVLVVINWALGMVRRG